MANAKQINSTEKLLNLIRGEKQPFPPTPGGGPDISLKRKPSLKIPVNFSRFFKGKKPFQVGVDIGRHAVSMVKMTRTSDGNPLLADYRIVKFSDTVSKKSPEFNNLLKSSIAAFAGSLDDCDVWAMMSAAEVNVFRLKIPIVPANQMENVIYWAAKKKIPLMKKKPFTTMRFREKSATRAYPNMPFWSTARQNPNRRK